MPPCLAYAGDSTSCGRRRGVAVLPGGWAAAKLSAGATLASCPSSSSEWRSCAASSVIDREATSASIACCTIEREPVEIDFVSVEPGDCSSSRSTSTAVGGGTRTRCVPHAAAPSSPRARSSTSTIPMSSPCRRHCWLAARQLTEPAIHFTRPAGAFDTATSTLHARTNRSPYGRLTTSNRRGR